MARYKETTGFLIHQRDFKDSSLILEFFSKDSGLISIIAKGIKKNKSFKPQLQYFSLLKIQYFGQSQLKTLSGIDVLEPLIFETLLLQTTGLYLNELLRYSLVENETVTELFNIYQATLKKLGKQRLTPMLRHFEKTILKYNGFELQISSFPNQQDWLGLSENNGLFIVHKDSDRLCYVNDLQKFLDNEKLDKFTEKRINKLMLKAIDISLANRRIYSRELLKNICS